MLGNMFVQLSCKAFDSFDHHLLLNCPHDLGISGTELQWFTDYLSGRMQCLKLWKALSQ